MSQTHTLPADTDGLQKLFFRITMSPIMDQRDSQIKVSRWGVWVFLKGLLQLRFCFCEALRLQ